jgi:hypothetical protein
MEGLSKYVLYVLLLGNAYILPFQERDSESNVLEE